MIILDDMGLDQKFKEEYKELKVYFYSEIIAKGEEKIEPWSEVTPESIYAFSYTSGTTGTCKGA